MLNRGLIALSGGVDSAVAAMLSIQAGFECTGATMKLHPCAMDCSDDARAVADRLGIPFHVFDFSECFAEKVISRFIGAYREGRTPNPCVDCNRHIKFGRLLEKALELGSDFLVTGHYAQVQRGANGRFLLKMGADPKKDQSYVLYSLTQEQLSRIHLPLGELSKKQVRELALSAGLDVAQKRESQDICFVPDGDYVRFITESTGEVPRKGRFMDVDGNDLGEHDGVISYTVGQRRGLGLAMPHPPYVLEIHPEDDVVVVGKNDMMFSRTLVVGDINLIAIDSIVSPLKARVKIRYKQPGQPATIIQTSDDSLRVEFDEPQRAITKGQSAVIYDGDYVIGGGTIE